MNIDNIIHKYLNEEKTYQASVISGSIPTKAFTGNKMELLKGLKGIKDPNSMIQLVNPKTSRQINSGQASGFIDKFDKLFS